MNSEEFLPSGEGSICEGVDSLDLGIRHREAANRNIGAVNHDEVASSGVSSVEGVRVADVEREVIFALRVHLARGHEVEPFRHLAVTLTLFGARVSRGGGDMIGFEKGEFVPLFDPEFELAFLFEGPYENGRSPFELFLLKGGLESCCDFLFDRRKSLRSVFVVFFRNIQTLGAGFVVDKEEGEGGNKEAAA